MNREIESSSVGGYGDRRLLREKYYFPLDRYMSRERLERFRKFADSKPTPCLIIDLETIRQKYLELKKNLQFSKIYYAIKANPMVEVVSLLSDLGSNFDVASVFELDELLRLGVTPDRISFGNTIKKKRDIAYFYEKGVRVFATDSAEDIENIAEAAPGSKVFFRLITEGTGSDWPLSRKIRRASGPYFLDHYPCARSRSRTVRRILSCRFAAARYRTVG